ncbi:MAG: RNA polymerase sigma-70 factor [Bacteroidia bacterium]|nr:MAG: RNA polymerase sigma-70 factor [Bacteroidia bacterium]
MEESNRRFIEGLRVGDRQIFAEIFESFYEPLCRYAVQRVYSEEIAEEIVQDIFVKLWIKRKELNVQTSLRAYLYRTALNRIINHKKHKDVQAAHHRHAMATATITAEPSSDVTEKELMMLAAKAVAAMPEKRRRVYELSRKEGLKYAEIADAMGISVKTVEAHLSAALEHMRKHLRDYLPVCFLLMMNYL